MGAGFRAWGRGTAGAGSRLWRGLVFSVWGELRPVSGSRCVLAVCAPSLATMPVGKQEQDRAVGITAGGSQARADGFP